MEIKLSCIVCNRPNVVPGYHNGSHFVIGEEDPNA